jgi:peptidoglycan/xylan/chitin deacetylase (PgdA/CDA1 family)
LLTFDVDAEAPILAAGSHYAYDLSAMSHQAYGPRVGVPRILSLLDDHNVSATFFVPGVTAERWPDTVSAIAEAGHEIALHGYSHRRLTEMSDTEQRADLDRGLAALHEVGVAPVGYRAPFWQITHQTLDLVAEHGLLYDSSLMDDDSPYLLSMHGREFVEMPVHWSLDDWEQYAFLPAPDIGGIIEIPTKVSQLWEGELDAMRTTGSLCILTCHPFLSGRPSRVRAIEHFIEFASGLEDVRIDRADWLARSILSLGHE